MFQHFLTQSVFQKILGLELQVKRIVLSLKKGGHLSYLIEPRPVLPTAPFADLYGYCQDRKLVDYALVAQDGTVIPLHKLILYHNGGEVMRKIVDPIWEESAKASLNLSYSSSTLNAFVQYLYLGADKFFKKMLLELEESSRVMPSLGGGAGAVASEAPEEMDVFELLELATFVQLAPLTNICTNLISLIAQNSDCGAIEALGRRFDNSHLIALAKALGYEEVSGGAPAKT